MNKYLIVLILVLTLLCGLTTATSYAAAQPSDQVRGVWVASVLNLDYPMRQTTDADQLRAYALDIIERADRIGFNTIYLQVRPTSDALYRSELFTWSKYLTGVEGQAPSDGFDPLQFWVEQAHKRNIEVHAWINPYRITKRVEGQPAFSLDNLHASNPARQHPDWVVAYSDGNLYYDPALPQVQRLIVEGVEEIIQNYDVDGVHFDDYFYPGKDFNDERSYQLYGKKQDRDQWRRNNVNAMVSAVYRAVKRQDESLQFGISPFGIWANQSSMPSGSATSGNQSYFSHYADSLSWIKMGIIDYIMPQIYWHIGFDIADYRTLLDWWIDATANTDVDLIIGQAAYRSGATSLKSPWYGRDEIHKQLALNATKPQLAGSVFFRDGNFAASRELRDTLSGYYQMVDSGDYYRDVKINMPTGDISTSLSQYYISGYSNPFEALYINGQEVTNRSTKGYFGQAVTLSSGENRFVVSQSTGSDSISIYRGSTPGTGGDQPAADSIEIPLESADPYHTEMYRPGEKFYIMCRAPIGAEVTAFFNGDTIKLTAAETSPDAYVKHTTYRHLYQMPLLADGETVKQYEAPLYKMVYQGREIWQRAQSTYMAISEEAPYFARANRPHIDTYFEPDPSKGSDYLLAYGMTERVARVTSNYVKLSSGNWVKRSDVTLFKKLYDDINRVLAATYKSGDKFDYIDIEMEQAVAVELQLRDQQLAVTFSNTQSLPEISNLAGGVIDAVTTRHSDQRSSYLITFKNFADLHGYYSEKTEKGVRIYLKNAVRAKASSKPLSGITIMIDAGHGGSDTGALGLLAEQYAEKHINLQNARKLQAELEVRGAAVVMTRQSDRYISLQDRLRHSLAVKPDLFISLHANSIGPSTDISRVRGFSAHYKREIAKDIATSLTNQVVGDLERFNRGVIRNNFYVVRGTWTPSVLLEVGFVPNPIEYQWLTDDKQSDKLAQAIAEGIVAYFRR